MVPCFFSSEAACSLLFFHDSLFKMFLYFPLPMAWDLHHSVLVVWYVNFAFNFNVQHAMKVLLLCLINICCSFHCFCSVTNLQFFPLLPDIILYFWMNLTSAVFYISVYLILLVQWSVFLFEVLWNQLPFMSMPAHCCTLQIAGKTSREVESWWWQTFKTAKNEKRGNCFVN